MLTLQRVQAIHHSHVLWWSVSA